MLPITLGELLEFQRGYDLPKSHFMKGSIPVISSNGILGFHNEARVKAPGITIGRSGTVGLPHFIEQDFFPHNTSLFVKDFKGNDPKYLFYLLKNLKLNERKSGSGVPTMNRNHLHPLLIKAYKDSTDQKKIAKVLSILDKKIELNNRINTELEAIAKTFYDYWFVQFDFPMSEAQANALGKSELKGKPYKTSGGKMVFDEVLKREIPEGWEVLPLSLILKSNYASIGKDNEFETIEYLDTSSLTRNVVDVTECLNPKTDKIPSRAKRIVKKNDILYSTVRPNLCHYGIIKNPLENMVASTGFVQLSSKIDWLSNDLVYAFLTSSWITERLQQIASLAVSSYPSISPNDIFQLNIALPKKGEGLENIQSVLDTIYLKISVNQKQNQQLIQLRDWLLPMLMNGQVTVIN